MEAHASIYRVFLFTKMTKPKTIHEQDVLLDILNKDFKSYTKMTVQGSDCASIDRKDQKIHHVMAVYPNGDRIHNGVHSDHLDGHLKYNKLFRPGRAVFVNGKCVFQGHLTKQTCSAIEQELQKTPVLMRNITIPYK